MAKTPAQGGKVMGGYYKLPKGKNAKGKKTVGYQGKSMSYQTSYHNQHYLRTGEFGHNSDAKVYQHHMRRSLGGSAAGFAVASLGMHAQHGHNSSVALAGSTAAIGYGAYHQHKANQLVRNKTGTRSSAVWGFHQKKH